MGDVALVPSPGGPWPGSWQCLERLLDAGNGGACRQRWEVRQASLATLHGLDLLGQTCPGR